MTGNRRGPEPGSSQYRASRLGILSSVVFLIVVLLLGIPSVPSATAHPTPAGSTPLNLTIHRVVASESPNFWTVDIDGMVNAADSQAAAFLNATPIKTLRYGDNWLDQSNWTNGCYYNDNNECSGAQGLPVSFGTLCQWLKDQCILGVPAETNNVSTTTALVHWLAGQTSWKPTCWAIGNEPPGWTHFGIPWTSWSTSDAATPTALQFAQDSANLTDATTPP
ncbi:MAG: hypothetical protein L3K02_05440, partial [Thermoplasmata archaeon]|nr:hypothetical protein [Thermoplasmata archaeon]